MKLAGLALMGALCGCAQKKVDLIPLQTALAAAEDAAKQQGLEIARLKASITRLEAEFAEASNKRVAILDPAGGGGYQALETNIGPVLVSFVDAAPIGDGTKIRMQIGNTSSADFSGAKLTITYGRRFEEGTEWVNSLKTITASVATDIRAGSWTNVSASLPGMRPDALGYLAIGMKLDVLSLQKARS